MLTVAKRRNPKWLRRMLCLKLSMDPFADAGHMAATESCAWLISSMAEVIDWRWLHHKGMPRSPASCPLSFSSSNKIVNASKATRRSSQKLDSVLLVDPISSNNCSKMWSDARVLWFAQPLSGSWVLMLFSPTETFSKTDFHTHGMDVRSALSVGRAFCSDCLRLLSASSEATLATKTARIVSTALRAIDQTRSWNSSYACSVLGRGLDPILSPNETMSSR